MNINENYLFNSEDLFYNKEKFDSGEINLCFITGHSGSGKTTMAHYMSIYDNVEMYQLDALMCTEDYYTMDELKEHYPMFYAYFKGRGKRYYMTLDELIRQKIPPEKYEDLVFPDFIRFAIEYAKKYKYKRFVLEGVWIYKRCWFDPEDFKNYAVYIKGTSMLVSKMRAAKRKIIHDPEITRNEFTHITLDFLTHDWKFWTIDEPDVMRYRKYFVKLIEKQKKGG